MEEEVAKFVEELLGSNPVFVVGSGASAGAGISGMGSLAEYLIKNITELKTLEDTNEWNVITKRLEEGEGLEEALQKSESRISENLTREIIGKTWGCISQDEKKPLLKISIGNDQTGLSRLFRHFSNSSNGRLEFITTNYDQIIEWAASINGWQIWDGFDTGPISYPISASTLDETMLRYVKRGKHHVPEEKRHLRIYKPHGSLNWFRKSDGRMIKLAGFSYADQELLKENNVTPEIVTPGTGKYLKTHLDPYNNILAEMNRSIQNAKSMLFFGFGFNDIHIQGQFDPHLRNSSIPKLILARTLTDKFHELVECRRINNYIAIEKSDEGSNVYSDKIAGGYLATPNLWTLNEILTLAWGAEKSHV
ncbi:SIR2 family protein [Pontibacillus salipaludis]|uniref:SIR2 family protein n=1 Tax=Pontibacillus salipaludis TaxID=1697394 RepID=UPI0031F05232